MGGCRCSFRNCTNTTKTRDNLHFFHYPVKQKDRCRQWIENAYKPQFYDLDEDQLRNKVICETHFEDCYFPNIQRKRLLQGAIPTLEGDCNLKPGGVELAAKVHDVEVLPANDDGTIFVLETNMKNQFKSEKVESYIYTKNGLMVPINKCNALAEDCVRTIYSGNLEVEEIDEVGPKIENVTVIENRENYAFSRDFQSTPKQKVGAYDKQKQTLQKSAPTENRPEKLDPQKSSDEFFSKTVGNQYVKKIKQHSKDIAILKRILKSKRVSCRRPSNNVVLGCLKRYLPPSLFSLVSLHFNGACDFSSEDVEFFTTIQATSPEAYQMLCQKYNWKLPNPELLKNINASNGRRFCD